MSMQKSKTDYKGKVGLIGNMLFGVTGLFDIKNLLLKILK